MRILVAISRLAVVAGWFLILPTLLLLGRSTTPFAERYIGAHSGNGANGILPTSGPTPCALPDATETPPGMRYCPPAQASASMLGAHTLYWQENDFGTPVASTQPINTASNGSILLLFNAGSSYNDQTPTDNKGNTWMPFGPPVEYRGYNGDFDVKAYAVLAAHGGNGHVATINKPDNPGAEITMALVEIRNVNSIWAVAQNYPATSSTVTSGSVTTTGPATLLAFWWGDASGLTHSAVPNNGFSIIENFVNLPPNSAVQGVVAYRQVAAAGTYNVSWTNSPPEGAILWLFAFQSSTDAIYGSGFE